MVGEKKEDIIVTSNEALKKVKQSVGSSSGAITEDEWLQFKVGASEYWFKKSQLEEKNLYKWTDFFTVWKESDTAPLGKEDGFCDVRGLLQKIEAASGTPTDLGVSPTISESEINVAMSKPDLRKEFQQVLCQHPTEWSKDVNVTSEMYRKMKAYVKTVAPTYPEDLIDIEHKPLIENLQWWDDIFPKAKWGMAESTDQREIPDPKKLWFFNPIAFVEHMEKLNFSTPLTEERKAKIIKVVAQLEGDYWSCNKDYEFTGKIKMKYTKMAHIGLSWGFIQFTQDGGMLGKVLKRMEQKSSEKVEEVFGNNWKELIKVTNKSGISAQQQWANDGRKKYVEGGDNKEYRSTRVQKIAIEKNTDGTEG